MLYLLGNDPFWFVLLSGFVFFAWGEIYSGAALTVVPIQNMIQNSG